MRPALNVGEAHTILPIAQAEQREDGIDQPVNQVITRFLDKYKGSRGDCQSPLWEV